MPKILKSSLVKKIILFGVIICCFSRLDAQNIALKTNLPVWLTATPNIGVELALDRKWTLDADVAYNPWTYKDDKKMKFWLVQPELRYWFCEKFEGHFVGVHLHGAQYFGGFRERRYDGYLAGFGISYGYNWLLSPHWNIEATIGVGYARMWYKESPRIPCIKCYTDQVRNYIGPTRFGLSIVYLF